MHAESVPAVGPGRTRDSAGFTLIELMVVVVVLAILLAVAIPTFLGARDRANTASAKTRTVQALKTQKTLYADGSGYIADPARLESAEPSLDFRTFDEDGGVASDVDGVVYIKDVAGESVTIAAKSAGGDCYWARDQAGQTEYAKGGCAVTPVTFSSRWP